MAKDRLTKQANISASIREQDFVTVFGQNWQALQQILGITRAIRKAPGTKLVANKAKVTLQSGAVSEGDEIPYSQAEVTPVVFDDVTIKKYAKAVSIEAVAKYGAAVAVQKTDEAFRNELQNEVLTSFYTFLKTGELTNIQTTWQMALAMAKGLVLNKFQEIRKTATDVVGFANLLDAYAYLGAAGISVQTQFGINYVKDFMGYSTLFLMGDTDIPSGTVIALPIENIDLYYIDPSDSEFAQLGLEYTTDGETNLIGLTDFPEIEMDYYYSHAVGETYAIMGMKLWAEYIDGIAVVKVEASGSVGSATFTSGAGTTAGTKITVTAPATLKSDWKFYVKAQASTAPATPAYKAAVDDSWTEIFPVLSTGIADNVTGFTAGHKMVMAITNGSGQTLYTRTTGVDVVNHA